MPSMTARLTPSRLRISSGIQLTDTQRNGAMIPPGLPWIAETIYVRIVDLGEKTAETFFEV